MKTKATHSLYSALLSAFWLGIYTFDQPIMAAFMASVFGSFALVSLTQYLLAVIKPTNPDFTATPSDKKLANASSGQSRL